MDRERLELQQKVARYRIVPITPSSRQRLVASSPLRCFEGVDGNCYVCQRRRLLPSPEAVARAVAIHKYCQVPSRTLLMRTEIEQYFPSVFRSGLPFGYYVETATDSPTLGFIRVDTQLLPITRLLHRTQELIERHARAPPFRKLIARQRFHLTWLMATATKADAIHDALSSSAIPVRAVGVHELLELVMPLANTLPDVAGL